MTSLSMLRESIVNREKKRSVQLVLEVQKKPEMFTPAVYLMAEFMPKILYKVLRQVDDSVLYSFVVNNSNFYHLFKHHKVLLVNRLKPYAFFIVQDFLDQGKVDFSCVAESFLDFYQELIKCVCKKALCSYCIDFISSRELSSALVLHIKCIEPVLPFKVSGILQARL